MPRTASEQQLSVESAVAYRFDLQVRKVGTHAAVAAAAEAYERELRGLILTARRQEALVVELVRVFEVVIYAVLHAGGGAADVALRHHVRLPVRICTAWSCQQNRLKCYQCI